MVQSIFLTILCDEDDGQTSIYQLKKQTKGNFATFLNTERESDAIFIRILRKNTNITLSKNRKIKIE